MRIVLREVAASGVEGIALGMLLRCTRPAVAVAPERHAIEIAGLLTGRSPASAIVSCGSDSTKPGCSEG
jgi:hypothetical protein